jgi:putative ABC transport system permease protein
MDLTETIQSSLTALLANRMRSFLTILGIVIGVTSVIVLIALVSGLKTYITSQIEGLGSNIMIVIPGKSGTAGRGPGGATVNRLTTQNTNELKTKLRSEAEVAGVVTKAATIKLGSKKDENATVFGTQGNIDKIIKVIKTTEGRFMTQAEADSGKRVTIIGPTIKKNIFGDSSPVGKAIQIGNLKYQVIGVAASRGSTFGQDMDNVAIVPLEAAQKQFGTTNVNSIYISANSPELVKKVQKEATEILAKRISDDDFTVQTQEQTLSTISQITGVLTLALGGVAAISLIVGGIGIMNIMLVSVTERTREIGLRKALGAQDDDIRNQFLVEALTLSGFGGIVGIALGFLISFIIGQFFTTTVPLWSVALSFGFSLLVGVIFGVTPAIRASKLDPITALRYE